MAYDYAFSKIEKLYMEAIDHMNRLQENLPNADWVEQTTKKSMIASCRIEFKAAANTVIEIFIELSGGDGLWRDLFEKYVEYDNDLEKRIPEY